MTKWLDGWMGWVGGRMDGQSAWMNDWCVGLGLTRPLRLWDWPQSPLLWTSSKSPILLLRSRYIRQKAEASSGEACGRRRALGLNDGDWIVWIDDGLRVYWGAEDAETKSVWGARDGDQRLPLGGQEWGQRLKSQSWLLDCGFPKHPLSRAVPGPDSWSCAFCSPQPSSFSRAGPSDKQDIGCLPSSWPPVISEC